MRSCPKHMRNNMIITYKNFKKISTKESTLMKGYFLEKINKDFSFPSCYNYKEQSVQ